MTKEVLILIEEMIRAVETLDNKGIDEVDSIWDKHYDKLIELAVDENCGNKTTCDEEVIHDEMADIRVLYYKKADEFSYECKKCGKRFYGRESLDKEFCRGCIR